MTILEKEAWIQIPTKLVKNVYFILFWTRNWRWCWQFNDTSRLQSKHPTISDGQMILSTEGKVIPKLLFGPRHSTIIIQMQIKKEASCSNKRDIKPKCRYSLSGAVQEAGWRLTGTVKFSWCVICRDSFCRGIKGHECEGVERFAWIKAHISGSPQCS